MNLSVLSILFILLTIGCIYAGIRKGMMTILYVAFSWVFVLWFISTATPYVIDYIEANTHVASNLNEKITERIQLRYDSSEEEEPGSGEDNILKLLPRKTREEIKTSMQNTVDQLIGVVANELTDIVLKILATGITILISVLIIWLGSKLVAIIGHLPLIRGVNKGLGFVAGFVEALLIIWAILYVAECFPTTILGSYIVNHSQDNVIMVWLCTNNFIRTILS